MQMDVEGSRGVKTAACKRRTEASEEAACPHLELGLPASRTVSKYISVLYASQPVILRHSSPSELKLRSLQQRDFVRSCGMTHANSTDASL